MKQALNYTHNRLWRRDVESRRSPSLSLTEDECCPHFFAEHGCRVRRSAGLSPQGRVPDKGHRMNRKRVADALFLRHECRAPQKSQDIGHSVGKLVGNRQDGKKMNAPSSSAAISVYQRLN